MNEEEKNEEKDKCPLSSKDWVMFLNDEIHHEEMRVLMRTSIFLVVMSIFVAMIALTTMIVYTISPKSVFLFILPGCFVFVFLPMLTVTVYKKLIYPKGAKEDLEELREKVMMTKEKELDKSDEIYEKWKEIKKKKRGAKRRR
jgi:hypothetical protein